MQSLLINIHKSVNQHFTVQNCSISYILLRKLFY